jgi:hypothetical protein
MGAFPRATVPKLELALKQSARDLGAPGADNDYGYGFLDVMKAYSVFKSENIGIFRSGSWHLDLDGNGMYDDCPAEQGCYTFGNQAGDVPVAGDWNGDGKTEIGFFRAGIWFLDMNGNGVWEQGADRLVSLSVSDGIPVAGDWNGDGKTDVGIFRNGSWHLDLDGNGIYDDCPLDRGCFRFGTQIGDIPVTGDWTGSGRTKIGFFRKGTWYLDIYGNGRLVTDGVYKFGAAGDIPVAGDWDGDGVAEMGVYRNGDWLLDTNGNGAWETGIDTLLSFGGIAGDIPVTGKW